MLSDVHLDRLLTLHLIDISKKDLVELGLFGSILGHIGDGNFHETILFEDKQRKEVEDCVRKMVVRAIEMEGTCTVSNPHPDLKERLLTMIRVNMVLDLEKRTFFGKRLEMCPFK